MTHLAVIYTLLTHTITSYTNTEIFCRIHPHKPEEVAWLRQPWQTSVQFVDISWIKSALFGSYQNSENGAVTHPTSETKQVTTSNPNTTIH